MLFFKIWVRTLSFLRFYVQAKCHFHTHFVPLHFLGIVKMAIIAHPSCNIMGGCTVILIFLTLFIHLKDVLLSFWQLWISFCSFISILVVLKQFVDFYSLLRLWRVDFDGRRIVIVVSHRNCVCECFTDKFVFKYFYCSSTVWLMVHFAWLVRHWIW